MAMQVKKFFSPYPNSPHRCDNFCSTTWFMDFLRPNILFERIKEDKYVLFTPFSKLYNINICPSRNIFTITTIKPNHNVPLKTNGK